MQSINFGQFTRHGFESPRTARQAATISKAILAARSPRLSDIARKMPAQAERAYKPLQRFLHESDPRDVLGRLFQTEAAFVMADPTAMPRRRAYQTADVGISKDGRYGFGLLRLATAFRGRALPFHFVR